MVEPLARRSAVGARIIGDDLQFLIAWYWLLAARRQSDISLVEIEAQEAGNLDDVVIRRVRGPDTFCQVKATVSAREPLSMALLMKPSTRNGPSIIGRFFQFWRAQGGAGQADLRLITNRSIDPQDPFLAERDVTARVADAVRRVGRSSALGTAIDELAIHLETDEPTLAAFLDDLQILTDATEASWIQRVSDVARPDIAFDRVALLTGVGQVRDWVKRARPRLTRVDVQEAVESLRLVVARPKAVVAVSAVDTVLQDDALVTADFMDQHRGGRPSERRGVVDPTAWSQLLGPQIEELALECRRRDAFDVLVRAACRLPTWFKIGSAFGETAGFSVATVHQQQVWDSTVLGPERPLNTEWLSSQGDAGEMAIFVSMVADNPATDVRSYLGGIGFQGGIVMLRREQSTDPIGAADGPAYALAIRNVARELVRTHGPVRLHVFLACPAPLALLIGHLWDRLPKTQLYEDLGLPGSYEPAFDV